jgi:hypothetical protein
MIFSKRVLVLACVAGVILPQQALSRSAIVDALRRAERSLCKVVDAKGCNRKKSVSNRTKPATSRKVKIQKPEALPTEIIKPEIVKPEIAKPGTTRVIVPAPPVAAIEKLKPPLPRPKPLDLEEIPPEPTIDIPPEPTTEIPAVKPKRDVTVAAITPRFAPPPVVAPQSTPDAAACFAALAKLNVTFTQNASYAQNGSCNVVNAVQLKSYAVNGTDIEFPDHPILNCAFASQFMNFIHERAQPTFTTKTTSKIAKLYTGPGFVCRGRNGDVSAKLSEHASGNAVDIERIQLADGRIVLVKDAISTSSIDYDVLTTTRHAACTYFTTVLGPGANAAHASHFHFDSGQHGKSGTYRICE